VIWQRVGRKAILLNIEDGSYFEVDPVGLAIWRGCDGSKDVHRISRDVARQFRVSQERVRRDVIGYLGKLTRENLLVSLPPGSDR